MLRSPRSDRIRRRLDRRSGYFCERWTIRDSREWACRRARGRTLEIAVGTGLNLRWYPADIELVAVDLDPGRLAIAAERAQAMSGAARVAVADGHQLPFGPNTFDTVVCTLAICDVEDRAAVLEEAHRVLRPGGSLLLVDHLEPRWRHGRPATLGARVGFALAERQRLWAGYFERVRLQKLGEAGVGGDSDPGR